MNIFSLFKKKSVKSSFWLSQTDSLFGAPLFKSSRQKQFDNNTIINACATFIRRAVVEAELQVFKNDELLESGDVLELFENPNQSVGYSEKNLRQAIAVDLAFYGNAYLQKVYNLGGGINELWWLPAPLVEPKPLNNSWALSHYEVNFAGLTKKFAPDEIIHFRDSIDATNPLKGYSPFQSLLSDVLTDEEAKEYTYWFLFNKGVIGSIISPKFADNMYARMTVEEAEELKKAFQEDFTGVNRGKALVSTFPISIESVSVKPDEMLLEKVRDIPEERITAVLNIPSAVVGLGTGLQQTKVGATMRELREQAYDGTIAPILSLIKDGYEAGIASVYDDSLEVEFDLSNVKIYNEDLNEKHRRVREDFRAGLITLGQASQILGYDVSDTEAEWRFADLAFGSRQSEVTKSVKSELFTRMKQREEVFKKAGLDLDELSRNGQA